MDLWMQLYVRKAVSDWNYLKTTDIVLGLYLLKACPPHAASIGFVITSAFVSSVTKEFI